MKIFIETDHLILRELHPVDEQGMFELDTDPEVHRFLGNNPLKTIEEVRAVIAMVRQQYVDNGIGRWAVVEKASGDFVGWAGFKHITELTNGHVDYLDIGYRLIKKCWGRGYATEATKACLAYGFGTLNQADIFGMTALDNFASKRVLEKSGLRHVEVFDRGDMMLDWFAISRDEWIDENNELRYE